MRSLLLELELKQYLSRHLGSLPHYPEFSRMQHGNGFKAFNHLNQRYRCALITKNSFTQPPFFLFETSEEYQRKFHYQYLL